MPIVEPLEQSAPLAWEQAKVLCRRDADGASCAWYHGPWQTFRRLGLVAAPGRHQAFFAGALGRLAADGEHPNIVISGAADYGMLAQVLAAYGAAAHNITVVDICETPLYLCRWYGERQAAPIATERADILDYTPPEPVDVITAHSILPRIAVDRRADLLAAWRRALRPGGKVVTSTRLNPGWSRDHDGFSAAGVAAFRARALTGARLLGEMEGGEPGQSPEEIAAAAETFAQRFHNFSIRSQEELVSLFAGGGFEIEQMQTKEIARETARGIDGPGAAQTAVYAELVAVRK